MASYVIPLTPEPQSFAITLAGRELRLTVRWFEALEAGWLLDIAEPEGETPLVVGIPLLAGCDLLEPYAYLELGGVLYLAGSDDLPPALDTLGTEVDLVFEADDEDVE